MAGTFPALLKTLILCVVVGNNVALLPPDLSSANALLRYARLVSGENVCDVTAYPYNAVGDNRTDDTNALQAAIYACAEKHPLGAVIVLPSHQRMRMAASNSVRSAYRDPCAFANITLAIGTRSGMYSARGPMDKVQQDSSCPTLYWPTAIRPSCAVQMHQSGYRGADRDTSVIDGGGWPWYLAR